MLDYVAQNDVDTVVVLFLDRFGRNPRDSPALLAIRRGGRHSPDSRRVPLEALCLRFVLYWLAASVPKGVLLVGVGDPQHRGFVEGPAGYLQCQG